MDEPRGQTVAGRVIAEASEEPVSGALVTLSDPVGTSVGRTLTDAEGRFTLEAPGASRYRIRAERIGFRPWTSPELHLERAEVLRRTFRMETQPVSLPELDVRGCVPAFREVPGLEALWGEIETALRTRMWTLDAGLYRFRLRQRRTILDGASLEMRDQETNWIEGVYGRPFVSVSPERASEDGYVQVRGDSLLFFAPTASTLLSDAFEEDHCFRTARPLGAELRSDGRVGIGRDGRGRAAVGSRRRAGGDHGGRPELELGPDEGTGELSRGARGSPRTMRSRAKPGPSAWDLSPQVPSRSGSPGASPLARAATRGPSGRSGLHRGTPCAWRSSSSAAPVRARLYGVGIP